MDRRENKNHWYDGDFYKEFIAPYQMNVFKTAAKFIPSGSTVLDIACGTGAFGLEFHKYYGQITGIDLSRKNINTAKSEKIKKGIENIDFIHGDASALDVYIGKKYDFGIISYAIHEMPPHIRIKVLQSARRHVDKLITAEYLTPQPKNHMGLFNFLVELMAGPDHFRNYRNFQNNGGIIPLIKKAGFAPVKNIIMKRSTIITLAE
ncbi:MAG: class I SAM-dependent methyltransferase [Candidatus Kapaibacterium sp.]